MLHQFHFQIFLSRVLKTSSGPFHVFISKHVHIFHFLFYLYYLVGRRVSNTSINKANILQVYRFHMKNDLRYISVASVIIRERFMGNKNTGTSWKIRATYGNDSTYHHKSIIIF